VGVLINTCHEQRPRASLSLEYYYYQIDDGEHVNAARSFAPILSSVFVSRKLRSASFTTLVLPVLESETLCKGSFFLLLLLDLGDKNMYNYKHLIFPSLLLFLFSLVVKRAVIFTCLITKKKGNEKICHPVSKSRHDWRARGASTNP
jgi:hypothetical protein